MTKLEIRGLAKAYGAVKILDGLTLAVPSGGRVVILGPSGSGKTTLLRLIAGLDLPDAGEVLLDGAVMSAPGWAAPPSARKVGMVFQSPALWPHMTAAENIRFGLGGLERAAARQRVGELLAALGLEGLAGRFPHELSGGEARRVALARALAPHPALLLLDEPLTNLNLELKAEVHAVLEAHLAAHQPTLVYVTHDPAEAEATGGQVLALPGREGE